MLVKCKNASARLENGFFSDVRVKKGDLDAARRLFSALKGAVGPMRRGFLSFGDGVLTGGFDAPRGILLPHNAPETAEMYYACGAKEHTVFYGYTLPVRAAYEKIARFRALPCAVRSIDRAGAGRIADILGEDREGVFRALGEIPPLIRTKAVFCGEDGFLLLLIRGGRARVATGWIRERSRNSRILLSMAKTACEYLMKRGIETSDISVIDKANEASRRTAESLGAAVDRTYVLFVL
ncbi:MAG: hypothetical protein ACOYI8_05030 [Christensenellales bacterium]|jgi:hypothetical protein